MEWLKVISPFEKRWASWPAYFLLLCFLSRLSVKQLALTSLNYVNNERHRTPSEFESIFQSVRRDSVFLLLPCCLCTPSLGCSKKNANFLLGSCWNENEAFRVRRCTVISCSCHWSTPDDVNISRDVQVRSNVSTSRWKTRANGRKEPRVYQTWEAKRTFYTCVRCTGVSTDRNEFSYFSPIEPDPQASNATRERERKEERESTRANEINMSITTSIKPRDSTYRHSTYRNENEKTTGKTIARTSPFALSGTSRPVSPAFHRASMSKVDQSTRVSVASNTHRTHTHTHTRTSHCWSMKITA